MHKRSNVNTHVVTSLTRVSGLTLKQERAVLENGYG